VGLSESSSQYFVVFITILLFAIDGLIRRKVSQTNFDYPSPLAYRYRLYIMLGSVYLLFMGLTLPFPLPQQSIPVGIFIVLLP
jgi:hypothetical protein